MTIDVASLKEGDEIPTLKMTPGREHVKNFFPESDSQPNFFFSEEAAKAQGLPGTIIPGPMKTGFLFGAVHEWLGDAGYVRAVRAAHRRPDLQGDPITVAGHIARVYEEDGARRADLELLIINHEGQPSVRGFATVEFW